MTTSRLDIRDENDSLKGSLVMPEDSNLPSVLTISDTTLSRRGMAMVLAQGPSYLQDNSYPRVIDRIEFINCSNIPDQGVQPADFSDLYAKYKQPYFSVKAVKFSQGANTKEPILFRYFADTLLGFVVFDIKNNNASFGRGHAQKCLDTIDLSGNELDVVDLGRIKRLNATILPIRRYDLSNCGLTDAMVPQLIDAVKESQVCHLYLQGNKICRENLGLIADELQKNAEAYASCNGGRLNNEHKVVMNVDLPSRVERIHYCGADLEIPMRGGTLDLSQIVVPNADADTWGELVTKLTVCDPVKISLVNSPLKAYEWGRILVNQGLVYSETVKELDFRGSAPKAEFCLGGTGEVEILGKMVSRSFPNTEVLIADNNFFAGTHSTAVILCPFSSVVTAPNLRVASFANCSINDLSIIGYKTCGDVHMTAEKAGDNLRIVNLSNNPEITNKSAAGLLKWVKDSNITQINLDGTNLSITNIVKIDAAAAENAKRLGEEAPEKAPSSFAAAVKEVIQPKPKPFNPAEFRERFKQQHGGVQFK